jgi:formate hydrogenlyase subunit 3/multisubunit Na+/H+ antiporter MnhD subunit
MLNVLSTALGLAIAVRCCWASRREAPAAFGVYLPGNWPVPFGIVLVADRLSALMAVLTGTSAWRRCCTRWRAGSTRASTSTCCSSCS